MRTRPIKTGGLLLAAVGAHSCASTPVGEDPSVARAAAYRDVAGVALDIDRDGRVGRYEAAVAAMALVDTSASDDGRTESASAADVARALQQRIDLIVESGLSDDPLTFVIDGERAIASGVIDSRSPMLLLELLATETAVEEIVLERVEGATGPGAHAQLASILEASGLSTRVPSSGVVVGPGVELLAAGARRTVEAGARVGVVAADGSTAWLGDEEIEARQLRTEAAGLEVMSTGTTSSLRGLSAVNLGIAWATGSDATVVRTLDGGESWANVAPESIAGLDVRDVYALSADVAWIMCAGPAEASRILLTADGGKTWTEQHRETRPEAFLDGLDFWEPGRGLCYGDPMENGRFRVLTTTDGGGTWVNVEASPKALESGEASFAASGTGLRVLGAQRAWIATGATDGNARVFMSEDAGATWIAVEVPVAAAKPGAGAFSVAFTGDGRGVVIGGDYLQREVGGVRNAAWSADFGRSWHPSEVGPRGQRAGAAALANGVFVATGQTGTDISRDGGRTWRAFSSEGFHCVDVSPIDGAVWFAGPRGRVARLR